MCLKYLVKGGQKFLKADRYDQLIDQVLGKSITIADKAEIELAHRLLIIKKINVRRLQMELKQLKEFGKEVGLKLAQINKMEEDALVLEIIRNVEPKVQYSKELVEWYNELPDKLFDQAEAESGAAATPAEDNQSTDGGVSIDDVIEVVTGYTKKADLLEILEDNDVAPLFQGFDASGYKLPTQLKKAMIDFLTAPPAEPEPTGDGQSAEIIELINACENEDQLVEVYTEYQDTFADLEVPDDIDEEALQQLMLNHVTAKAEPEPEVEKKPMTLKERLAAKNAEKETPPETKKETAKKANDELFDWWTPEADDFDVDATFALVEELKMTELRKFAKHIGLSVPISKKKDEILDLVANKITELAEGVVPSTEDGEIELTVELVNDAVKAKDRETLNGMCDQLEIKLNALQKKSIPGMQKKLIEAIGAANPNEKKTEVKARGKLASKPDKAEDQSVYAIMESMVIDGKSNEAITKAVSPIYKERGKSIIFIKKRIDIMIGIIKVDNDLAK